MKPEFYAENARYSEALRDRDPRQFQSLPQLCAGESFYGKYLRALQAKSPAQAAILDVGCGAGQVVRALVDQGFLARGVDVSATSIALAQEGALDCQVYGGKVLPFEKVSMDVVGAFNVLEHVEEPVAFLDEMNRVLKPGGRLVLSSPNFLRVLGWRDYHPRMQGVSQKLKNLRALWRRRRMYAQRGTEAHFETMPPILREPPQPDDDATVVTNAIDTAYYLKSHGFVSIQTSCVDRPVPRVLEILLDATPLRYLMLNAFVTATKKAV